MNQFLIGYNDLEVTTDQNNNGDFDLATHVTEVITDVFNARNTKH